MALDIRLFVAAAVLPWTACGGRDDSTPGPGGDDGLRSDSPGVIEIARAGPTMIVRGELPRVSASEAGARQLVARYPEVFGLGDSDSVNPIERIDAGDAVTVVRLQRTHNGLPVFAGELRVGFSAAGAPVFIQAPAPDALDVSPDAAIDSATARAIALAAAATWGPEPAIVTEILGVFVPLLYGTVGSPGLAYRFDLRFADQRTHVAFVDAASGSIEFEFSDRAHSLSRTIYKWDGPEDWVPTTSAPMLVSEGDPPPDMSASELELEAYIAYVLVEQLHDFLGTRFAWDSWDGQDAPYVLYVGEPVENASWFGTYSSYGVGFVTMDVIAHEHGHGLVDAVVQRPHGTTSRGLVSCGESLENWIVDQPVACGESMALDEWAGDVLAALVAFADPFSNCATDSADCWRIDADNELIRDMSQRSKRTIIHYTEVSSRPTSAHRNSAVPSLATYLLADSSPQHPLGSAAPPVRTIGVDKVGDIYFRALRLYVRSSATFEDVRYAWLRACEDLVDLKRSGFQTRDCGAVLNAWAAVGVGPRDTDEDTWHDEIDNCKGEFNPDQLDTDGNGVGDACEEPDQPDEPVLPELGFFPCPSEFPSAVAGAWPLQQEWADRWVFPGYGYMCRYARPATLDTFDVDDENFSFTVHWHATADPSYQGCGKSPLRGRESEDTISDTHHAWVSHNGYPVSGRRGAELELEFRTFVDQLLTMVETSADGQMVPPSALCE